MYPENPQEIRVIVGSVSFLPLLQFHLFIGRFSLLPLQFHCSFGRVSLAMFLSCLFFNSIVHLAVFLSCLFFNSIVHLAVFLSCLFCVNFSFTMGVIDLLSDDGAVKPLSLLTIVLNANSTNTSNDDSFCLQLSFIISTSLIICVIYVSNQISGCNMQMIQIKCLLMMGHSRGSN